MNEAENWQTEGKDEGCVSQILWIFVIIEDSIGIVLLQVQVMLNPWFDFSYSFSKQAICVTRC